MSTDTWLSRIELNNFRLFEHTTLDFHRRLTVLVANNGSGKSTVLDAIALAFSPFVDLLASQYTRGLELRDVRLVRSGETGSMERALPASIRIACHVAGRESEWSLTRDLDRPRSKGYRADEVTEAQLRAYNLRQAVVDHAQQKHKGAPELPLLVVYGTSRVWDPGDPPGKSKRLDTSRLQGYTDCLRPTASFAFFVRWFTDMSLAAAAEVVDGIPSPHAPRERLDAVRRVLGILLRESGWTGLRWDPGSKDLLAEHPRLGTMPVAWLSDGIKSILAMAADLAHRCVRLNPHFGAEAAALTSGIALIDEVDMHLHPAWQQTVLENLQEAFPRLQFVVTTHSPQVLTTVDVSCIRVLDGTDAPPPQTLGVASQDVLAVVMGVSPTPDVDPARWLSRYRALVQQGLGGSSDALELRVRLDRHFGLDHPVMREVDRLIRLQSLKPRRAGS